MATAMSESTEKLGDEAKSFASNIAHKAESATEAVGACMESFGETLCEHSPQHGMLGDAGQALGEKLENGGRYLEEKGLKGIGDDVTNFIRSNPVPSLLVGMGVGFLIAKIMRS
jgi:hypothetical protein